MSEWTEAPSKGEGLIPVRGLEGEVVGRVVRYRFTEDGTVETEMTIDEDYLPFLGLFPGEVSIGPFLPERP